MLGNPKTTLREYVAMTIKNHDIPFLTHPFKTNKTEKQQPATMEKVIQMGNGGQSATPKLHNGQTMPEVPPMMATQPWVLRSPVSLLPPELPDPGLSMQADGSSVVTEFIISHIMARLPPSKPLETSDADPWMTTVATFAVEVQAEEMAAAQQSQQNLHEKEEGAELDYWN